MPDRDVRFHANRAFTVGDTWTAKPRPGVRPENQRTRTIVRFWGTGLSSGGPLVTVRNKGGTEERMRFANFACWAGERVATPEASGPQLAEL